MHTTAKTSRVAKPKATPRTRARRPAAKKALIKVTPTAQDLAERDKIGKTLDVEAFMAFHKENGRTSSRYWETKE